MNRKPIDAYAVLLDRTSDYNIDPADAPYIQRIQEAYLFDRNQQTHCCELTASYYLIFLYVQVELTDAGEDLDDKAREALYERYEFVDLEDHYVHCGDLERIIAANKPGTIDHYGDASLADLEPDIDDADERHDTELETIRNYLHCNHPF